MLMISNVISMGRSRCYMLQVWARESVHRKDKINHGIPINGMFTLCEEKKMKYETLIKTFCKICMYGTGAGSFTSFYQFFIFLFFHY